MARAPGLSRPPPRAFRAQFSSQVAGNCLREKILAPVQLSPRIGQVGERSGANKKGVLARVAMGDNWAWVDGEPILLSGLGLG